MTKTVIFVGSVNSSYVHFFQKLGATVCLFVDKFDYLEESYQKILKTSPLDFILPVDLSSRKAIEDSLKKVFFKRNAVVITTKDKFILPAAQITEVLGLDQSKNISVDLAIKATNKISQRKAFSEKYPEITPPFRKIRTFHGAYTFSRKYGFPLVVKPASLAQSQLVSFCYNLEDLIKNVSYVLDQVTEVYKKNKIYRKPLVLIEKFVEGDLYSVDSYVDKEGNIYHTEPCREFTGTEMGMNSPELPYSVYNNEVSSDQREAIFESVSKAIKSLGITSSPTHVEVKIDKNNTCKIIELNLRAGGMRDQMLSLSYEVDHKDNILKVLMGNKPIIKNQFLQYSGFLKIWPKKQGIFLGIKNLDEMLKLDSVVKHGISYEIGQEIGSSEHGFGKTMYFIVANKLKDQLDKDVHTILETIDIKVSPQAQELEDF